MPEDNVGLMTIPKGNVMRSHTSRRQLLINQGGYLWEETTEGSSEYSYGSTYSNDFSSDASTHLGTICHLARDATLRDILSIVRRNPLVHKVFPDDCCYNVLDEAFLGEISSDAPIEYSPSTPEVLEIYQCWEFDSVTRTFESNVRPYLRGVGPKLREDFYLNGCLMGKAGDRLHLNIALAGAAILGHLPVRICPDVTIIESNPLAPGGYGAPHPAVRQEELTLLQILEALIYELDAVGPRKSRQYLLADLLAAQNDTEDRVTFDRSEVMSQLRKFAWWCPQVPFIDPELRKHIQKTSGNGNNSLSDSAIGIITTDPLVRRKSVKSRGIFGDVTMLMLDQEHAVRVCTEIPGDTSDPGDRMNPRTWSTPGSESMYQVWERFDQWSSSYLQQSQEAIRKILETGGTDDHGLFVMASKELDGDHRIDKCLSEADLIKRIKRKISVIRAYLFGLSAFGPLYMAKHSEFLELQAPARCEQAMGIWLVEGLDSKVNHCGYFGEKGAEISLFANSISDLNLDCFRDSVLFDSMRLLKPGGAAWQNSEITDVILDVRKSMGFWEFNHTKRLDRDGSLLTLDFFDWV